MSSMPHRMMILVFLVLLGGCAPILTEHQWSEMADTDDVRAVAVIGRHCDTSCPASADSLAAGVVAHLRTECGFDVRDPAWTRSFCDSLNSGSRSGNADTAGQARFRAGPHTTLSQSCFSYEHVMALGSVGVDVLVIASVPVRGFCTVHGYGTSDGLLVLVVGTGERCNLAYDEETRDWVYRSRSLSKHIDRVVRLTAEVLEHPRRRYGLAEGQPWTEPVVYDLKKR